MGAVERDSDGLFRDAMLYIGQAENLYLTGEKRRRVIHGFYKLPQVYIDNSKVLLRDGQLFDIEGIKVECFLVPGHTWGHMVYLIDDTYLFTGDTIWFGSDGGRQFYQYAGRGQPYGCPLSGGAGGKIADTGASAHNHHRTHWLDE